MAKELGKGVTASNVFGRLLCQTVGEGHGDAVVLRDTCLYQGLRRIRSDGFVCFERRNLPKGWI